MCVNLLIFTLFVAVFQYFEGRIFCVGDESVSAVEFAPDVIEKARVSHR